MADPVNKLAFADFYNGTVKNETKSLEMGRPIFDDVEMIRIRWAGNTKNEFHAPADDRSDRPVTDPGTTDKYWPKWKDHPDFRAAYEAFKQGQAIASNGTPLEEWSFLTAARRAELKAINIMTVDQIANLGPDGMKRLGMEGGKLKEQAKLYLERAAGSAVDARYASEREEMQRQIDELKAMMHGGAQPATVKTVRAKAKPATDEPDLSASPFFAMDDESILLWCKEADPTGEQPKRHHKLNDANWHLQIVQHAEEVNARLKSDRTKAA